MAKPDTAIVVTTIFEPKFLQGYLDNLQRYDHASRACIIVIPDRKTPASVEAACKMAQSAGFDVRCPGLDAQVDFLNRLGAPADWIPFNSDNRRNVGYLMALASGCKRVISIDDDNFCPTDEDFVSLHSMAGTQAVLERRHSSDGWINLCEELDFQDQPATPFPRGFPYSRRASRREFIAETTTVTVALNAGLWLQDPDVDAISRISANPIGRRYVGNPFVLGDATWSPINTQNTSLSRAAMAAYYYVRMGFPIEGLKIDRYGDILSGYFAQKCIRHCGEAIRIGDPICAHIRTPHNLFKDLYHELAGMVLIEELVPWLIELKLSGPTYTDAYACLADELAASADRFTGFVFDQGGRDFLRSTADNMQTWLKVLQQI